MSQDSQPQPQPEPAVPIDPVALEPTQLLPIVYRELRMLAGSYLKLDPHHTLQPTALVHEAYIKIQRGKSVQLEKSHFIATAAVAMRQILVDHARAKNAIKRGGAAARADIALELLAAEHGTGTTREMRVLELDELLTKLAMVDSRASRVAELRLFGGMEQSQIALVLCVSRSTVANDWAFARAWLSSEAEGDQL